MARKSKITWKCRDCGMTSRKEPHRRLHDHMLSVHGKVWDDRRMAYVHPLQEWHVVEDTSRQDELADGPVGIAITPWEDDVSDAICWMQEGGHDEAMVMAASRELLDLLVRVTDELVIVQEYYADAIGVRPSTNAVVLEVDELLGRKLSRNKYLRSSSR